MKLNKLAVSAFAAALAAAGCSAKPSLVGTWNGPSATTYTFQKTGKFTVDRTIASGPFSGHVEEGGTYAVDNGNHVTITKTTETVSLTPSTQNALTKRLQAMHPGFPALSLAQPRTVSVPPNPHVYQLTFKDPNTADLAAQSAGPGQPQQVELTRATAPTAPASQ